jgi:putative type I restriction modification DNA specificity domain protein
MSHINSVQYLGRTVLYEKIEEETIIHGMNLLRLRARSDIINPSYARYCFYGHLFRSQIANITKKSVNQASFAIQDLKQIKIDVPEVRLQKQIVEILNKISWIIDKRKQELDTFDELIKARFVELFGYPLNSTKGWLEQRLGECCVINPKKNTDNRLREDLVVSFIPMASVSEKGDILKSEDKFYRDVKNGFTYFCDRDVLFAKITPCMENGKGAVAVGLKNGIGFGSTEFHVLRPIMDKSNSYWLYTLTSFDIFRKKAEKNMTGSAGQKRVPASFLENIQVSVPPINIQNEFEKFVIEIDKSKFALKLLHSYIMM